jgi:hypothetical protein
MHHILSTWGWLREARLTETSLISILTLLCLWLSWLVKPFLSDWSASKTVAKDGCTYTLQGIWVVHPMLGYVNWATLIACHDVISTVISCIDILASHHSSNLCITVPFFQISTFWAVVVLERQNVIGSTTIVLSAGTIFIIHCLQTFAFPLGFFIHKFPSVQVSFIFLNSFLFNKLQFFLVLLFTQLLVIRCKIFIETIIIW